MVREVDDEAASVVFPPKDHLYFFYGVFRCKLGVKYSLCSSNGFLGGEGGKDGVDNKGDCGGYAWKMILLLSGQRWAVAYSLTLLLLMEWWQSPPHIGSAFIVDRGR